MNISNQKIYKVAMYIRLSREDGDKDESTSITNQRNILVRFITLNDSVDTVALNYTLAVFDTDNNMLYFYEMDT